jgi:hypothetical protein
MTTNNVVPMQTSGAGATTAPVTPVSNLGDVRTEPGSFYIGEFGGRSRYIRFDLNAFAEMENLFGNMEEAQTRLSSGSMNDIKTVLWLGLIHDEVELDPITGEPTRYTLSKYTVGHWLTALNLPEVVKKLQASMNGSMPNEKDNEAMVQRMNESAIEANNVVNPSDGGDNSPNP